jgi:hypothetical protein
MSLLEEALDPSDILGREIKCGDPPCGPGELAQERDVPTRAAASIEHRPAGFDTNEPERILA